VGYRQLWAHLDGACGLPEAVAAGQRATRNLAKRQLTWLRSEPSWIGIHRLEEQELVPILRVMGTVAAR
jgi:tRNA A37 N6-isopentenylltransferase MiaA